MDVLSSYVQGRFKNSRTLVSSVEIFLVCKWKNSFHYVIVYAFVDTRGKCFYMFLIVFDSCDRSSVCQSKIKQSYTVQFLLYRKVIWYIAPILSDKYHLSLMAMCVCWVAEWVTVT